MTGSQERKEDLKDVLSTVQGRRFVWGLLSTAGIFGTAFRSGSPDATAFNCGMQNFGLNLLSDLMSDVPELYLVMQREAMARESLKKEMQAAQAIDKGEEV